MKHQYIFSFYLCLSLILLSCSKDDNQIDQQVSALIGTWKLVKFEGNATSFNVNWVFTETSVSITTDSEDFSGTYTYDANSNPKSIDITIEGASPNPNLGIYKLVGQETLIIKLMDCANNRSSNFDVEQGYDLQEFSKQ